ncbi:3-phosphoglycerate dehydrogenase family protein [Amphibacillus cookii]|uniref:3-phosphoglycerate dehydrogenase family protein n=1 Tax=Amphibacillus cookii TaxID=767787 RepID=UPI001957DF0A|nr:3-phosphoglycerate dehydrogenase family protein [Amphibacillus cookii]MBM7540712.1 D-3-phosphoglycerate dehydrogenase [Amphibacillus cookii]
MGTAIINKKQSIQTLNVISEKGLEILKDDFSIDEQVQDPEAIMLRSYNMHDMEFGSGLRAIARAGAGVNNIPVEKCTDLGVVVFNTPGANANAVKELVLTTLMAASRQLFDGIAWARKLEGQGEAIPKLVESGKKQFVGKEVRGKTLGVIGLGAIGARVANDALELGMDVVGFDPFISIDMAWQLSRSIKRVLSIEELFAKADYITIHVPLTEETKGMFNRKTIQLMKDNVFILNFSRDQLINDQDMAEALSTGKVGKYITDFPNETVLSMENVIPIPHLGASSKESEENCAIMAARQLKDYLETGNISNSVNFPNANLPYTGRKRLTVFHLNVPNMVGQITSILSDFHLNIADMVNRGKQEHAYTIIDVEDKVEHKLLPEIEMKLKTVEGIVMTRFI